MPDIFINRPAEIPIPPANTEVKKHPPKKDFSSLPSSSKTFASFISRPLNLRFETQEKKEKVVLLLRRHPVTNVPWLFMTFIMAISPIAVLRIILSDIIPPNFQLVGLIFWYLFTFTFAFERFLNWFFNVNIITDERVIDIDFPTLLLRSLAETKIDKIQNISLKTGGYIRSLFNFGDVLIQSAEAVPKIIFEAVPSPDQVSKILNDLLLEEEQEKIDGRVR